MESSLTDGDIVMISSVRSDPVQRRVFVQKTCTKPVKKRKIVILKSVRRKDKMQKNKKDYFLLNFIDTFLQFHPNPIFSNGLVLENE